MVNRFSLISAAVFAGVVVAGGLISSGTVNPADALSSLTSEKSPEQRSVQDQTLLADTSNGSTNRKGGEKHDEHHNDDDAAEGDDD